MDRTAYERWWAIHVRVARGEGLSAEAQAAYDAGLKELHQEEGLKDGVTAVRRAREAVIALKGEHARLEEEREKLDAESARLESALSARTR